MRNIKFRSQSIRKRYFPLMLALLLLTSIVTSGCTSSTSTSNGNPSNSTSSSAVASADVSPSPSTTIAPSPSEETVTTPQTTSASTKRPGSIIPDGWELTRFGVVEGDLNQDGLIDQAVVVQEKEGSELDFMNRYTPKRKLIIRFANPEGGFKEMLKTDNAVLKETEGGVMGDPFHALEIQNGSLLIRFYGGSRQRWSQDFQFRYQENDFYLIGAKFTVEDTLDFANNTRNDYNLLTGDFIQATSDSNGNWIEKKSKREKKALIKLINFDVRAIQEKI